MGKARFREPGKKFGNGDLQWWDKVLQMTPLEVCRTELSVPEDSPPHPGWGDREASVMD
jgi:hypothetical protein